MTISTVLQLPVWQQLSVLALREKDMKTAKFVVNGCGAAGSAIGRLLISMGAENVTMVDRFGALYEGIDANLDRIQSYLATVTNKEHKKGTLADIPKALTFWSVFPLLTSLRKKSLPAWQIKL